MLGALLGSVQSKQLSLRNRDPFHELVAYTVNPISGQVARGIDSVADFAKGMSRAASLAAENRAYRDMARAADMYSQRLEILTQEIDSLRKMIDMPKVGGRTRIPAEISALMPSDNRITITVGSNAGVEPGMPVVTGDGLVGVVQVVSKSSSQVTLISSPYLRVGAITLRNPPSAGLLHGESANMTVIEFLDFNTPVQNGDWIVTSGFSDHIPRGIPIGRVIALDNSQEFGTRRSRVFPFVHIGAVREVFVLK